MKGSGEAGISGVTVTLTGTDYLNHVVSTTAVTGSNGAYTFTNLLPGRYTVTETQPAAYFDGKDTAGKVNGLTVGTAGNDTISAIDMIFNGTGTDYNFGETLGSIAGLVYVDSNSDGIKESNEAGLSGVTVSLTGTDANNKPVSLSTTTDGNGSYSFGSLLKGLYKITESQPAGFTTTKNAVGTINGVTTGTLATPTTDVIDAVLLQLGSTGINYNFGEIANNTGSLRSGDTATIGFWHNNNGQALIKSLNGCSTATALGNWLAANFPNLYGSSAGANNLGGKTNAQIAAYDLQLFSSNKTAAQVFGAALAVYVTSSDLAGGNYAGGYGFNVSSAGTGSRTYNVGSNGAAFGVANNTTLTILSLLKKADALSSNGLIWNGNGTLTNQGNVAFSDVNQTGDIAS